MQASGKVVVNKYSCPTQTQNACEQVQLPSECGPWTRQGEDPGLQLGSTAKPPMQATHLGVCCVCAHPGGEGLRRWSHASISGHRLLAHCMHEGTMGSTEWMPMAGVGTNASPVKSTPQGAANQNNSHQIESQAAGCPIHKNAAKRMPAMQRLDSTSAQRQRGEAGFRPGAGVGGVLELLTYGPEIDGVIACSGYVPELHQQTHGGSKH